MTEVATMTIQLSTADKRDAAALLLFTAADTWQHKITVKDGRRVYGIPSRSEPGTLCLTDGVSCNCPDAQRRNVRCAHIRAAALYRMKRAAEVGQPADVPAVLTADDEARLELAFAALSPDAGAVARTVRPSRYEDLFPTEN